MPLHVLHSNHQPGSLNRAVEIVRWIGSIIRLVFGDERMSSGTQVLDSLAFDQSDIQAPKDSTLEKLVQ